MKYKFKDPTSQIFLPGNEVVNQSNLTDAKYDELVKLSPKHAEQFELVRQPKVETEVADDTKSNTTKK